MDFRAVNVGTDELPDVVSIPDPDRYQYFNDGNREAGSTY
jgi:hypothetical protein